MSENNEETCQRAKKEFLDLVIFPALKEKHGRGSKKSWSFPAVFKLSKTPEFDFFRLFSQGSSYEEVVIKRLEIPVTQQVLDELVEDGYKCTFEVTKPPAMGVIGYGKIIISKK
ncbi:hypothetical protein [Ligilactobacillus equi]|uniref:NADH dehydrogenase I, D subunit n=2 Tax=Ligilactobacillus equi TaxID=137357 RepID=V7HU94_9LACO|nr:hypothetical protein [Ligilactobacillus equi]ETA73794.1 NADH dehydrogenase I, D subunit [Ligilactobacillus equi DPC 6820]KRL84416.1 hypothetical protein FC36_GL000171 [Ligilactobacillus equi DSM 15833 = JCM 10991]